MRKEKIFFLSNSFSCSLQSGCTTVDGVDDAAEFAEVKNSMATIGVSPEVLFFYFSNIQFLYFPHTYSFENIRPKVNYGASLLLSCGWETLNLLMSLLLELRINLLWNGLLIFSRFNFLLPPPSSNSCSLSIFPFFF